MYINHYVFGKMLGG